ncbi:Hypothetical predicted protein, partial [Pelobates cultripes]
MDSLEELEESRTCVEKVAEFMPVPFSSYRAAHCPIHRIHRTSTAMLEPTEGGQPNQHQDNRVIYGKLKLGPPPYTSVLSSQGVWIA